MSNDSDQSAKCREPQHGPNRQKLPDTRPSIIHKRTIAGMECFINVGFYDDARTTDAKDAARPGEIFVTIAKHGSALGGLVDALAVTASVALQYGVPWPVIEKHWRHMRFGDCTDGENLSLVDGLAKGVRHCITERCRIIGADEPPPPPPDPPTIPPLPEPPPAPAPVPVAPSTPLAPLAAAATIHDPSGDCCGGKCPPVEQQAKVFAAAQHVEQRGT